ncbi:unnamed protein product [Cylicocyclus nassatus]|uniref:Peptidase M12A domain-containing protein n=1 Tax=Cylicocyclus nassatus TaxID=53992 RepID=A0AA36DUE7_CYLNA|nr:unnamed protein product [Cylicocyclus nassatus]
MRVILLLLLLAGSSVASSVVEKIDKALSDIPTTLNRAELLANYKLLNAHEAQIEKELAPTPQQQERLQKLEAELAPIIHKDSEVETIDSVNRQTSLGELLYQSDIILITILSKMETLSGRVQSIFRKAVRNWQKDTCIYFIDYKNAEHRIEVVYEKGCSGMMGCIHQVQEIIMGKGCEHPAGDGKVLQATTKWQTLKHRVGYKEVRLTNERDDFKWAYFWIQDPPGRQIEVIFIDYGDREVTTPGCYWDGVEIKTQKDQRMTGYRQL